jgi:uncharacterized protein (TIGR00255 family)
MSGYGQTIGTDHDQKIRVEIRSLNHRQLDVHVRGVPDLGIEEEIRKEVMAGALRGKVDVFVHLPVELPEIDVQAVRLVVKQWKGIQQQLGLTGGVDLPWILSYLSSQSGRDQTMGPGRKQEIKKLVVGALRALDRDRLREGRALKKDFRQRVTHLDLLFKKVKRGSSVKRSLRKKKLIKKLKGLVGDAIPVEPGRLEQKMVLLMEKGDVTEELVRLESHIGALKNLLSQPRAIGRKMDFLLQEILRELNTIGAKASKASLVQLVLEGKDEVEKMREQAQNVE